MHVSRGRKWGKAVLPPSCWFVLCKWLNTEIMMIRIYIWCYVYLYSLLFCLACYCRNTVSRVRRMCWQDYKTDHQVPVHLACLAKHSLLLVMYNLKLIFTTITLTISVFVCSVVLYLLKVAIFNLIKASPGYQAHTALVRQWWGIKSW